VRNTSTRIIDRTRDERAFRRRNDAAAATAFSTKLFLSNERATKRRFFPFLNDSIDVVDGREEESQRRLALRHASTTLR